MFISKLLGFSYDSYRQSDKLSAKVNRLNRLTFVYTVATQFPALDYSHSWIPLKGQ